MARPLYEILDDLYASFEQWVDASRQDPSEIEIVWNEDLDRFRDPEKEFKIKWIVVGHNPGEQERGASNATGLWIGRYFHPEGSTGSWTRLILAHDVRYLERQVLFLEKTPICSKDVPGLRPKKTHSLFKQMQERMAEAVYELQEATGAFVWIQGGADPTLSDKFFVPFFSKLSELYGDTAVAEVRKERVFRTHHMGRLMRNGEGFPVERLLEEDLAKALPDVEGFEYLE